MTKSTPTIAALWSITGASTSPRPRPRTCVHLLSTFPFRRTLANASSIAPSPSAMPFYNVGGGHCHCHVYTPCHSTMGTLRSLRGREGGTHAAFTKHNCSICDFGGAHATLPLNRMVNPVSAAAATAATTLQRPSAMTMNENGGNGTLFRLVRGGSHSPPAPRLSAEF